MMGELRQWVLDDFLKAALKEDLGRGDLFWEICHDKQAKCQIIAKEDGIFSGQIYLERLCALVGLECAYVCDDGASFSKGQEIARLSGDLHDLLSIERVALNILQHSSGIATLTKAYVHTLAPTNCELLDTRKTRPLLRVFEKYSTKNGGARNHRFGLDDCLMLKDTHLFGVSDLGAYLRKLKSQIPWTTKIEVECENFIQFQTALEAGVDIIMCDNMDLELLQKCVELKRARAGHVLLEASGNINLSNLLAYGQSGVDAISTGSIIHQARWIDMSMKRYEN